jgi:hypothetical protein
MPRPTESRFASSDRVAEFNSIAAKTAEKSVTALRRDAARLSNGAER